MSNPKNSWYCPVCDFYVFNTKTQCKKCLTQKYKTTNISSSYDPYFDKQICEYFQQSHLDRKTACSKCKNEGRIFNKDPMLSNHNCWKYS